MIAHSPLGGPRRAGGLARDAALVDGRRGARRDRRPRSRSRGCSGSRRRSSRSRARDGRRRRAPPRAPRGSSSTAATDALRGAFGRRRSGAGRAAGDGEVVLVMGIPGAGKSRVAEEYVGARLPAPQPRRARRVAARARRRARRGARGRRARSVVLDNTYLTRAVAQPRDRGGRPARDPRRAASGSTRRSPRRRSTSSSGCSTASARCRRPRSCGAGPARAGPARADLADARRARARAAVGRRGLRRRRAHRRSCARRRPAQAGVFVAAAGAGAARAGSARSPSGGPDAPHLVFDWRPDGDRGTLDAASRPRRREVSGPGRDGALPACAPARRRCWCRPPLPGLAARVRSRARRRPGALDPHRPAPAHRTLAATLGARYVSAEPPTP